MAETLRGDRGSYGLVSGVGMHMQKHVFGLWSTTPPARATAGEPEMGTSDGSGSGNGSGYATGGREAWRWSGS